MTFDELVIIFQSMKRAKKGKKKNRIDIQYLIDLYRVDTDAGREYLYSHTGYFIDIAKRRFGFTIPQHLLSDDLGNSVFLELDKRMIKCDEDLDNKQIVTYLYFAAAGGILKYLASNINPFMRLPTNKVEIIHVKDVLEKSDLAEYERIEDEEQQNFKSDINKEFLRNSLHDAIMSHLNETQQKIILLRYNSSGEKYTYKQIAEYLGCSLQWVKQIEKQALEKLREILKNKLK